MEKPKLLDQVRNLIRMRHLSHKTEKAHLYCIRDLSSTTNAIRKKWASEILAHTSRDLRSQDADGNLFRFRSQVSKRLLVMSPHPKDFDDPFRFKDLVNESVLNVDSPRIRARKIANQLFEWRRVLVGILTEDFQQLLRFRFKS